MLLGAKNTFWHGKKKTPAQEYVQGGLFGLFDGMENGGWGRHIKSPNSWLDLKGNFEPLSSNGNGAGQLLSGYQFGDEYDVLSTIIPERFRALPAFTLEIYHRIMTPMTGCEMQYSGSKSGINAAFGVLNGNALISCAGFKVYDTTIWHLPESPFNSKWGATMQYSSARDAYLFMDGVPCSPVANSDFWNGDRMTYFNVGGKYSGEGKLNSVIYCIRLYDRFLSDEEIQINHEIDKKRFGI